MRKTDLSVITRFALTNYFSILLSWMPFALWAQNPSVASGTLTRYENFASAIITPRNVDVWVPDGYDANKQYAVLYMHDGQMLFDASTTWNKQAWDVDDVLGPLIKSGKVKECIVVGVWNPGAARHSNYFPQRPFERLPSSYRDSLLQYGTRNGTTSLFADKLYADDYLRFIVQELKPFIDAHYSTLKDPANTIIAGSSMGGLISMYAICEYPHVFGGAACLSTHWPGIFNMENNPFPAAFLGYLDAMLPSPKTHRLYFDHGTVGLDSLYGPVQKQADEILRKHGYNTNNSRSLVFDGADHSEESWKKRLSIPLEFLLPK